MSHDASMTAPRYRPGLHTVQEGVMGMISGMFNRSPMPSKAEEELRTLARVYGIQGEEDSPTPAVPGRPRRREGTGLGPEPDQGADGL